jgi:hypothetical protein
VQWTLAQIRGGTDPLGRGLAQLMDRGATQALFLAIQPGPAGSPVPHFVSAAALQPKTKMDYWTGLKWDPTVVPELWNAFVKTGFVELSPPGTMTNVASARNVVRGAFGVEPEEYLTLVRAGPANSCRGVLAIISTKSLMTALGSAMPLISQLPSGAKAA